VVIQAARHILEELSSLLKDGEVDPGTPSIESRYVIIQRYEISVI
jgi:hypothetical protein